MKRGDIIIIVSSLLAALFLGFGFFFTRAAGERVVIRENNELIFEGSLYDNQTVELRGNTVIIISGEVYVEKASCKNQICVKTGKISKEGESIVCLPNRVIIEIE